MVLNSRQTNKSKREKELIERLLATKDLESWQRIALELDELLGNEEWKKDASDEQRFIEWANVLRNSIDDVQEIRYILQSGLLRNRGGIGDLKMYTRCYIGTKYVYNEYIDTVLESLQRIFTAPQEQLSRTAKIEFFNDMRQSFGCTALLLQGGANFGLIHLGVVKTLFEQNLLPKVISGSSVGAMIAAYVCVHTDEELLEKLKPESINLQAFTNKDPSGSFMRKVNRFLEKGYLLDVKVIEDCVRENVGSMTFLQAYNRTGRILNITVASSHKHSVPSLLNYLTAPDVLIWSAACASAASTGIYSTVQLLAMPSDGSVRHWVSYKSGEGMRFFDTRYELDSPETRLAELFNVNHFISSQANIFMAPFVPKDLTRVLGPYKRGKRTVSSTLLNFFSAELNHRLHQLAQFNILPDFLRPVFHISTNNDLPIVAPLNSQDYYTIFSNPTFKSLEYWILKGEQSTWPLLSVIRNRVAIEIALDKHLSTLREESLKMAGSDAQEFLMMYHGHPMAGMNMSKESEENVRKSYKQHRRSIG
ncbi:hypothetical protein HK098_001921 [Nowakowskiella sp. JEL0407]|nr:hypothetical protein HK098_001921 [Nowakowskiella sp. JEL0407]